MEVRRVGRAGYWFIARYGELLESAGLALELLAPVGRLVAEE